MENTALATKDKALMGESTNKIIQFTKKKPSEAVSIKALSILTDDEIDEAIFILSKIKQEKDDEKRIILEHEFCGLVRNAWARETEGIANE